MTGTRVFPFAFMALTLGLTLAQAQAVSPGSQEALASVNQPLCIRLAAGEASILFESAVPLTLETAQGRTPIPAGAYTATIEAAKPARQRFHLFIKTFQYDEGDDALAYADAWRAKGFNPEILTFGSCFQTESGHLLDNRTRWVSLVQANTEAEADAAKARLREQDAFAWMLPETIAPGAGTLLLRHGATGKTFRAAIPLRLTASKPITVRNVNTGFWKEKRETRTYAGALEFRTGPGARLELYEHPSLEDYLAGVLPAEMPALWPQEALKAQAVAARSEVMTSMAGKHSLEGFNFCATEHCRAYLGSGGRHPGSDQAVGATRGMVLTSQGGVVPAVFSSDCGGWTENNDTVWAAPPDPALRGVLDAPARQKADSAASYAGGITAWIKRPPKAYCSADTKYFRWTRRFSAAELTATVNKRHAVGTVRDIELGERGPSGRLKRVRIIGSKKTEIVQKDLEIRLAFGGLPSAMFIMETEKHKDAPTVFTFHGGGRGHGVGLCQHGARGMAEAGRGVREILLHYFGTAKVERLK